MLTIAGLGSGDLHEYLPPPEFCTRFAVTVDGDTTVDAPALEPCTLGPLAGEPADAEDRHAPSRRPRPIRARGGLRGSRWPTRSARSENPRPTRTRTTPAGRSLAVVLPTGTTLEDVGRHRVWPSGVACMRAFTPEFAEQREEQDGADLEGPFALPVVAFPATGHAPACFVPFGLADALASGLGPDPVVLAAGSYDVYLEATISIDGLPAADERRCHHLVVDLDGDVTLEPPPATEWEACP